MPDTRTGTAPADEAFLVQVFQRTALTPREILRAVAIHCENSPGDPAVSAWQQLTQQVGRQHAQNQDVRIGRTLTAEQVGELLGKTRQAVHNDKLAQRLLVFAKPHRRGDCYPWLQFDPATHTIQPWVAELIASVGNGAASVSFLTARRRSLDGESYAERLRAGDLSVISAMLAQAHKPGEMDIRSAETETEASDMAPEFEEALAVGEAPGPLPPSTEPGARAPAPRASRRARKK